MVIFGEEYSDSKTVAQIAKDTMKWVRMLVASDRDFARSTRKDPHTTVSRLAEDLRDSMFDTVKILEAVTEAPGDEVKGPPSASSVDDLIDAARKCTDMARMDDILRDFQRAVYRLVASRSDSIIHSQKAEVAKFIQLLDRLGEKKMADDDMAGRANREKQDVSKTLGE